MHAPSVDVRNERSGALRLNFEDRTLLPLARQGDPVALDRLMLLYLDRTFRIVFRMLGNREDAEDVVQETFARAHQRLSEFQGGSSFGTWVTKIAIRLCIDQIRARSRREPPLSIEGESLAPGLPGSSEFEPRLVAERDETREQVERALDQMPHRLMTAFVLRVLEGLEYEEIARVLGTRVRSVRIYVCEARRRLAEHLHLHDDLESP